MNYTSSYLQKTHRLRGETDTQAASTAGLELWQRKAHGALVIQEEVTLEVSLIVWVTEGHPQCICAEPHWRELAKPTLEFYSKSRKQSREWSRVGGSLKRKGWPSS